MINAGPMGPGHSRVSCHPHGWIPLRSSPANRREDLSFPKVPSVQNSASFWATGAGSSLPKWHEPGTSLLWAPPLDLPTEKEPLKSMLGQCLLSPKVPLGFRGNQDCPFPLSEGVISYLYGHFHPSLSPGSSLPSHQSTSDSPPAQTLMGRWYPSHVPQTHAHPIPDTPHLHSDSQPVT